MKQYQPKLSYTIVYRHYQELKEFNVNAYSERQALYLFFKYNGSNNEVCEVYCN